MTTATSDVGSCVAVDAGNGVGGLVEPNSAPLTPDGFAAHEAFHVPPSVAPSTVPTAWKSPPKIDPVRSKESPSTAPYAIGQFVFADESVPVLDELTKHFEDLRFNGYRRSLIAQFQQLRVELEPGEFEDHAVRPSCGPTERSTLADNPKE